VSARVRRRADRQNLDSLLDTMANVTGILVVLMAVIQISVGDAMERLSDQLLARPELSRAALEAVDEEATRLRAALAPRQEQRAPLETRRREGRAELSALRREIDALESEIGAQRALPQTAADAEQRIARDRGRARDLEQALAREQAAIAALERELASLPSAAIARDARLPDSRRAAPGATPVYYAARHGRLTRLDARALVGALDTAVWRASNATDRRVLSQSTLLRAQVVEFFATRDIGDANLRWRAFEEGGELVAHLEWRRTDVGETTERLKSERSRFRQTLRTLDRTRSALQFLVWDDSFETYLAARKVADRAGFAAGWEPFDEREPLRQPITNMRARGVVID
jgi:hypothetical protein